MRFLSPTLKELIDIFASLGIPYAVMGGLAVRAYGVPRPTFDIDLTIALERDRLATLFNELKTSGYQVPEPYELGWVDEIRGLKLVKLKRYLGEHSIDIDLFLAETPFQKRIMDRRVASLVEDKTVWLVSPEDLVLLKLVAGRPRDLSDVYDVLFMQHRLDVDYMKEWATRLGISRELVNCLSEFPETYENN